jgi:hypothetical protein
MDTQDAQILRAALRAVKALSPQGATQKILLANAELEAGVLLTGERADNLWRLLTERQYIYGHIEHVTGWEKWCITARGIDAEATL